MARLLLVDALDRAALSELDGGGHILLDERASGGAGERVRVRTAVWSSAGQWAACAVDAGDPDGVHEVRLFPAGGDRNEEGRVVASALLAFYLCPSPCGRFLSHLSPGPLGLELAVSDVATGSCGSSSGASRCSGRGHPTARASPSTSVTGRSSPPGTARPRWC
jgi:hypothetical protein